MRWLRTTQVCDGRDQRIFKGFVAKGRDATARKSGSTLLGAWLNLARAKISQGGVARAPRAKKGRGLTHITSPSIPLRMLTRGSTSTPPLHILMWWTGAGCAVYTTTSIPFYWAGAVMQKLLACSWAGAVSPPSGGWGEAGVVGGRAGAVGVPYTQQYRSHVVWHYGQGR